MTEIEIPEHESPAEIEKANIEIEQFLSTDSPSDSQVKHALQTPWTLWYDNSNAGGKRSGGDQWGANLKEIFTFDTVEDFWNVHNNAVLASKIPVGANYHLFRKGIKPEWECPENKGGAKFTFPLSARSDPEKIDQAWRLCQLVCVGEVSQHSLMITGCVASVRGKGFRLSIWVRPKLGHDVVQSLSKQLAETLNMPEGEYSKHEQ